MAIQSDGKLVVTGAFYTLSTGYDFGLARYLANGALDTGFDSDGLQDISFASGTAEEVANGVAMQADGKIVTVGYVPGVDTDFALARLNPNGSLDSSFSGDGRLTTDFGAAGDIARGVAMQADGKIVVAGTAYMGASNLQDFAVARYLSGVPIATPTPELSATATIATTPTTCPIQFTDVPNPSTFYEFIRCLACRGIINGYPDGTFKPNNNVTRGQLVKIVSNSAGFSDPQTVQMFEDVPRGLYLLRLHRTAGITWVRQWVSMRWSQENRAYPPATCLTSGRMPTPPGVRYPR